MALITIFSTNPKLSYVLSKNPETIRQNKEPFKRELRKGKVLGWFDDFQFGPLSKTFKDGTFRLLFLDSNTQSSFAKGVKEEFEYLDKTRYANPYAIIMMISTALATASNQQAEDDKSDFMTYVSFTINAPSGLLEQLSRTCNVQYESLDRYNHKVSVAADTVFEALNLAQMICITAALSDWDFDIRLNRSGIEKYLKIMNKANAPYIARYIFKSKAITTREMFPQLKQLLDDKDFNFAFGNTQVQRLDAIKQALLTSYKSERLVDIGCGEMFHAIRLSQNYDSIVGFDADESFVESNLHALRKKQVDNITFYAQKVTPAFIKESEGLFEGADILLAEVLEHMEKEESVSLVRALQNTKVNRIIVTIPNRDFNKYFFDGVTENEEWTRHNDHKWEPNFKEFEQFLQQSLVKGWTAATLGIGDKVKDDPISFLAVITKDEVK